MGVGLSNIPRQMISLNYGKCFWRGWVGFERLVPIQLAFDQGNKKSNM
jgi:hypothetical protein